MIWKPIMIPSTYVKSMAFLMTSALDRMASEILSQDDIDMRETEQVQCWIIFEAMHMGLVVEIG